MPLKQCPKCSKECGPRTKICPSCNYDFNIQSSSSTKTTVKKSKQDSSLTKNVIGQGTWIYDTTKGLPVVEIPEPLTEKKLSVEQVREYISYEGLGYCIFTYIDAKKISDKPLSNLWAEARLILQKIQTYIYDYEINEVNNETSVPPG